MEKCREFQKRKQRAAVLFIDFKAAYNNVPLDTLFHILDAKSILNESEIQFLRALYSNIELKVG